MSVSVMMAAAVLLLLSCTIHRRERSRARSHGVSLVDAGWVAAPVVCADVTAGPEVTSPVATVARFSVLPLAQVAGIVEARVVHVVLLTRLGGLYGP